MRETMAAAVYPLEDLSHESSESNVTREARSTDIQVSRLTFPLPVMAAIVGTAISVMGIQYVANAGMRDSQLAVQSDVRDMRTRMEMQTQIDIARNEARTQEIQTQNEAINELKRLTQLLQLQYSELSNNVKKP